MIHGVIIRYQTVRIIQQIYYCSGIQYVLLGESVLQCVLRPEITEVNTAYTVLATLPLAAVDFGFADAVAY
jgi:hypothetical protein